MDISTAFTEIESIDFAVALTVAGRLSTLLDAAEKRAPVQALWEETARPDGLEALQARINTLCEQPVDPQYANPHDTALTIYLHLLYSRAPQAGKLSAERVSRVAQLGWADEISSAILSQEETLRQASR